MLRVGLDVGSTTLKCAVLDGDGRLVYSDYRRHFSRITESVVSMIEDIFEKYPEETSVKTALSGSAGMGFADKVGIPFVQEVYAARLAVKNLSPDSDAVIELGGEDAKILFLTDGMEVRMNGSCAGGTGAFIDQMATLLDKHPSEMNEIAG